MKVPENFLGRGFWPWVGRDTGNDELFSFRLINQSSIASQGGRPPQQCPFSHFTLSPFYANPPIIMVNVDVTAGDPAPERGYMTHENSYCVGQIHCLLTFKYEKLFTFCIFRLPFWLRFMLGIFSTD